MYRNINTTNVTPSNNSTNTPPTGASTNIKQVIKPTVPKELISYDDLIKKGLIHPTQFREPIIEKMVTILTTLKHPNVLLIGDAGVGKTAIVKHLAYLLHQQDPVITQMLESESKIYELPLTNLVAGNSYVGQVEQAVQNVVAFAENPNNHAILYFDEIHQLETNQQLKEVAEILKPALADGRLHVIGATTTQEQKFLNSNPAFSRRFSKVTVPELSNEQTITILQDMIPTFKKKHHASIDIKLIPHIVDTANQYAVAMNTHRPDSAITIMDQAFAGSHLKTAKIKAIGGQAINAVVTKKDISNAAKQLFNGNKTVTSKTVSNLQSNIDQHIIGQKEAKDQTIKIAQSLSLNLIPQTKPHSILFAGPTGTGKTEIAKQMANSFFGSQKAMINLNMTEYAGRDTLNRLIGSPRGYVGSNSAQPLPLDSLKTNPFQLVLLDEFEKANPAVQRIFMQALDEGHITLNDQSVIDFSHALIVSTTNAGADKLNESHVGFNTSSHITNHQLTQALTQNFPPELLNRFEHIVAFDPINKDQYAQILALKATELINKINQQAIYQITPATITKNFAFIKQLTDESYDPTKNGRPAERTVREYLEQQLINSKQSLSLTLK